MQPRFITAIRRAQGRVSIVDLRTSNAQLEYHSVHDRKINSIDFRRRSGDETTFATSSSSGEVATYDLRKLAPSKKKVAPLASLRHSKSCHSAQRASPRPLASRVGMLSEPNVGKSDLDVGQLLLARAVNFARRRRLPSRRLSCAPQHLVRRSRACLGQRHRGGDSRLQAQ